MSVIEQLKQRRYSRLDAVNKLRFDNPSVMNRDLWAWLTVTCQLGKCRGSG
jgi:hypothetical protein